MEIDYNSVFGIEDTGVNEQETAEPAAETEDTGAKEREAAEPADEAEDTGAKEQETAEPANETENTETEIISGSQIVSDESTDQSPEERSKYAAARRKAEAERDAAVEKAKAEAQRLVDDAFANSGFINPFTGQPIRSKAEFDEYQQRFSAEKRDKLISSSGLTEAEFQAFVYNLPEVRQAREQAAAAEMAQRDAAEAKAKIDIDDQLSEISKLDPSVRTVSDLAAMPNYSRFYELVQKGNNFVDAYKLANFDALTNRAQAAAKQAVLNAAKSKDHMAPKTSRGQGQPPVPADIVSQYRTFIPDASEAEIARHYNLYLKNKG